MRADLDTLSRVEADWLRALGRGTTVTALAGRSSYSEREVYRRLGALYRKLGARNRAEALVAAARFGLLEELADS